MNPYYHKINAPFKRHTSGNKKGRLIPGDWSVPEFEYLAGNQWEFTEKVDGTNIVIQLHRYEDSLTVNYHGRTAKSDIPPYLLNRLKELFPNSPTGDGAGANVGRWMVDNNLTDVLLYGEGYGPKIQKIGEKYRDDHDFVLFDVKIGNFWLDRNNVNDVASKLDIDAVPTLGQGTLQDAIDIVSDTMVSNWGDFEAEGIIARPVVPMFDRHGNRIITKIKGVDFK